MLGCASLPGTDPDAVAPLLASCTTMPWRRSSCGRARWPTGTCRIDRLPSEAVDVRAALRQLPPLLKAYLRMGGMIGDGAVIDRQFNTIDVCLVLPTERVQAQLPAALPAAPAAGRGGRLSLRWSAVPGAVPRAAPRFLALTAILLVVFVAGHGAGAMRRQLGAPAVVSRDRPHPRRCAST